MFPAHLIIKKKKKLNTLCYRDRLWNNMTDVMKILYGGASPIGNS